MNTGRIFSLMLFITGVVVMPVMQANASGSSKKAKPEATATANVVIPTPTAKPKNDVEAYCDSIFNAASDARFAWQSETIAKLEKELLKRINRLEAKRQEYLTWMKQRDVFMKRVEGNLVGIYAKMSPDSAALQISEMDIRLAAAIMAKLKPGAASAILAEMKIKKAAQIASAMSSMGKWTGKDKNPEETSKSVEDNKS